MEISYFRVSGFRIPVSFVMVGACLSPTQGRCLVSNSPHTACSVPWSARHAQTQPAATFSSIILFFIQKNYLLRTPPREPHTRRVPSEEPTHSSPTQLRARQVTPPMWLTWKPPCSQRAPLPSDKPHRTTLPPLCPVRGKQEGRGEGRGTNSLGSNHASHK